MFQRKSISDIFRLESISDYGKKNIPCRRFAKKTEQMNQTTPPSQDLLWRIGECRPNPNPCGHHHLLSHRNHRKCSQSQPPDYGGHANPRQFFASKDRVEELFVHDSIDESGDDYCRLELEYD